MDKIKVQILPIQLHCSLIKCRLISLKKVCVFVNTLGEEEEEEEEKGKALYCR